MTDHDADIVRLSQSVVRAICSCGWGQTCDTMQDAALAFGRHVTDTLPPLAEVLGDE